MHGTKKTILNKDTNVHMNKLFKSI